jgi:iron complex outermembrane receptor protein
MEAKDQDASNRAVPIDPGVQLYYPLADGSPDPREATISRLVTENYGVMPSEAVRLAYNAGWTQSNDIELYSFGTYSIRESILNWTFREPNDPNNIDVIYPEGFRPKLLIDETDFEIAFGGRGAWGDWQWDATTLYGQNKADRDTSETLNASLGPTSPTEFYIGQLKSADWVNTLDVTRAFDKESGELQVSWGAQYHREFYQVVEGDPASYAAGTFVFPLGHPRAGEAPAPAAQANHGITPEDSSNKSRNSFAVYGELGWSPNENLFAGIAARYEDYDDTSGDTFVGKVTGRYALSDRFALRATASTSFRVPPMAQQQHESTTSQFRDLDGDGILELLLIKQLPPESAAAIALGAVPLGPEESANISVGFTYEPIDSLIVTVDAYRIELNERISITSTLSGAEVTAILVGNGLSSSLSGQYYTNAIDTTTTGLDVVASYSLAIGNAGSMAFNLGFNTNDTEIDRIAPNPPALDALGSGFVLFDQTRQGNLTYGFPNYKGVFGVNWQRKNFNANVRFVQFGDYRTTNNNPAIEKKVDAETIVDLDFTYQTSERFSITLGANNVFNAYPTEVLLPDPVRGSGQYDTRGGFGFTGGSYYARFKLTY